MSYSKKELVEVIIEFKNEYGRYPTRQDFKAKKIKPSKNTFHRVFGGMEKTIEQAELYAKGELILEDEQEIKSIKPVSKKGGFRCAFCGNYTHDADEYYSSMAIILSMRFIKLLNSKKVQGHFDGVMDCIYGVFGGKNPVMRKALRLAGYLEIFEKRYDDEEREAEFDKQYARETKKEKKEDPEKTEIGEEVSF